MHMSAEQRQPPIPSEQQSLVSPAVSFPVRAPSETSGDATALLLLSSITSSAGGAPVILLSVSLRWAALFLSSRVVLLRGSQRLAVLCEEDFDEGFGQ